MSFDGLIEWDDDEPVIITGLRGAVESGLVTPEQADRLRGQSGPVIPARAVEAAAYAIYLDANPDSEVQWFDIGFHEQDELMRTATKVLEAAAPHMLAGAWNEGMEAMYASTSHEWPPVPEQNPYRPAVE